MFEFYVFLTKKLSQSSQKYGLGSGKNLFRIPDPGVKKAPDPGSGSATRLFWQENLSFFPSRIQIPDTVVKKTPDLDPQHSCEIYKNLYVLYYFRAPQCWRPWSSAGSPSLMRTASLPPGSRTRCTRQIERRSFTETRSGSTGTNFWICPIWSDWNFSHNWRQSDTSEIPTISCRTSEIPVTGGVIREASSSLPVNLLQL